MTFKPGQKVKLNPFYQVIDNDRWLSNAVYTVIREVAEILLFEEPFPNGEQRFGATFCFMLADSCFTLDAIE